MDEKKFFLTEKVDENLEEMRYILRKHFEGSDMFLYAPKIVKFLFSENLILKKTTLHILSVLLQYDCSIIDDYSDVFRSLLREKETEVATLNFLSAVQDDFLYSEVRDVIFNILDTRPVYPKKLALLVIFSAVKRSQKWKEDFNKAYKRVIFEKELRPLLYRMLAHVYSKQELPFFNIVAMMLPDIMNYNHHDFAAICSLFSQIDGDYFIDAAFQSINTCISKDINYCAAAIQVAKKVNPGHLIRKNVIINLENAALDCKDESLLQFYVFTIFQLNPTGTPPVNLSMKLLSSPSSNARLACSLMMKMEDASLKKTFIEVVTDAIKSKDIYYLDNILHMIPLANKWYSSFVMQLYNNKEEWSTLLASKALKLVNVESIPDLLEEFKKIKMIQDDAFGYEATTIISQFSNDSEDFGRLVSSRLFSMSSDFIIHVLNDAFLLSVRLKFPLSNSMKERLLFMQKHGKSREIRILAAEIESITGNS